MTESAIQEAESLFLQLVEELEGKKPERKNSLTPKTYGHLEEDHFRIEQLQQIQEDHYIMFVNAINDEEGEKHYNSYLEITEQIESLSRSVK